MRDGTPATVRTWDNIRRDWRFTRIGRAYYAESKDHFVVTFPAVASLVRLNGSVYMDKTVVKSTALTLGEIAVPSLMPSDEQLALVRAKTAEFISTLPRDDDNKKVLIEGGGSSMHMVLDDEADPVTGKSGSLNTTRRPSPSARTGASP